jgi:hypothetical protein
MNTDELVALLAKGGETVEQNAAQRRFMTAIGWGIAGAALLMAITLGVRPDLAQAAQLPMFWVKLAFPLFVTVLALYAAMRLAHPGMQLGRAPALLVALLVALWLLGAVVLYQAAPSEREQLIFGETWKTCPFNVAFLAMPAFAAVLWAMKGLAPTRPSLAGGAAGLLAGAIAAAVYALYCPELAAPFVGIWYVLGMLLPAIAGALIGPRLLHW